LDIKLRTILENYAGNQEITLTKRETEDTIYERNLIGKSRTEKLEAARDRVYITQKREEQDIISNFRKLAADKVHKNDIPKYLHPEIVLNLRERQINLTDQLLNMPTISKTPKAIIAEIEDIYNKEFIAGWVEDLKRETAKFMSTKD
jgi:hypothetical protein